VARPRAATYDDQREQILARAAELFARHGYTATTMNQVAAACGVTKPTLYHYFTDKQSLLLHIAAATCNGWSNCRARCRSCAGPPQRLRTLIERFMHAYAGAQNEHRVLTEDVRFLPEAERDQVVSVERRVVAALPTRSWRCGPICRRATAQAADHAAVRHDELDLHLAAARRRPDL
jgi:AcrR family transcriptional regulator